jgi:hypothetical protein
MNASGSWKNIHCCANVYFKCSFRVRFYDLATFLWHFLPFSWPSWPWSCGSWVYNYLSNQYLSPLLLWVRVSIRVRCTTLCDKICKWLATGRWFSPGPPVSSTNKTGRHDITEILFWPKWLAYHHLLLTCPYEARKLNVYVYVC